MKPIRFYLLLCVATVALLPAQSFTDLYSFGNVGGSGPSGGVLQGAGGLLYGMTGGGGGAGAGTIYRISLTGDLSLIYSFCAQANCADGASPVGELIQTLNGELYGTASGGGSGSGTIFKVTPRGSFVVVHTFNSSDGASPQSGLTPGLNGDLYGTTSGGGANNDGTIFRITQDGSYTLLHSFNAAEGSGVRAPLVRAGNGSFYGVTYSGGANNGGGIFRITPAGAFTVLYSFCSQSNCTDGKEPLAALALGNDGNLYGTTYSGGNDEGLGTTFKITPGGEFTTLYRFDGTNGFDPRGGLVQATDGNFYGTTEQGGDNGEGTIFQMSPEGSLATVYSFCYLCHFTAEADGFNPGLVLVQDTNGQLYGTTQVGGSGYFYGTVFSFSESLGPFIKTAPAAGLAGAIVRILGTDLTGATSVTFDGTSATFAVLSASEILAAVPKGAKSGGVQVVTPGGTLSSNVQFRVF